MRSLMFVSLPLLNDIQTDSIALYILSTENIKIHLKVFFSISLSLFKQLIDFNKFVQKFYCVFLYSSRRNIYNRKPTYVWQFSTVFACGFDAQI